MATIFPNPHFNPVEQAAKLQKAMKGLGTDEKAIIDVMTTHSTIQRLEISDKFEVACGKNLTNQIKKETKGKFQDTVVAMLQLVPGFLARELRDAMKGPGTDDTVLIEILCARTNADIAAIRIAYDKIFQRSLTNDVSKDTSGNFKKLLVTQCQANRDESGTVNLDLARNDAKRIFDAGAGRFGTDESVFTSVLCERGFLQLRATFVAYRALAGRDIEDDIRKETSGMLRNGYLTLVSYTKDSNTFFAYRLYKAMKGLGTDDQTLIRIVVSRAEMDLANIAATYVKTYGKTLSAAIKGDTKGDYETILLAITGGR